MAPGIFHVLDAGTKHSSDLVTDASPGDTGNSYPHAWAALRHQGGREGPAGSKFMAGQCHLSWHSCQCETLGPAPALQAV